MNAVILLLIVVSFSSAIVAVAAAASLSSSASSTGPFGLSDWIRRVKFGPSSSSSSSTSTITRSPLPPNYSIWVYQGALYDVLNGQHIANVHGVELIRPLAQYDDSNSDVNKKEEFLEKCGDLQVARIMRDYWKNDQEQHQHAVDVTTMWSRKFFCYQAPINEDADHGSQPRLSLLNSIRLHPTAPRRKVPPSQAMASYDSIISYISPNKRINMEKNADSESPVSLLMHAEFPNRQTVHGLAHCAQHQPQQQQQQQQQHSSPFAANTLDLNIYTRPSSSSSVAALATTGNRKHHQQEPPFNLKELLPQMLSSSLNTENSTSSSTSSSSTSPTRRRRRIKRSSLIQFGASSSSPSAFLGRFGGGARETYSYQINNHPPPNTNKASLFSSSASKWFRNRFMKASFTATPTPTNPTTSTATVRYTRQGEGPPWYGPHRLCTLELYGRRLDNHNNINNNNNHDGDCDDLVHSSSAAAAGKSDIMALCQTWAQQAVQDWNNHKNDQKDDDDKMMMKPDFVVQQFRNYPSNQEAVMGPILARLSQRIRNTANEAEIEKVHGWRRLIPQEAVIRRQARWYWQRISSSMKTTSTRRRRRRRYDDDDE